MEALGIAILIILGLVALVVALVVAAFVAVGIFAFLPLILGVPLGIWVSQYSTGLAVAIILMSVAVQIAWSIFLSVRWP